MAYRNLTEQMDDLWNSTFMAVAPDVYDQIRRITLMLKWLEKHSKTSSYTGRRIRCVLEYGSTLIKPIGKHGHVDLTIPTLMESIFYDWSHLAANISRNVSEESENSGKAAFKKLFQQRMDNLKKSFREQLDIYLAGDGTTADAPQGIRYFVRDDPTTSTSIGELNQSTYTWWQNKTKTSTGGATLNISADMRDLWMDIVGPQDDEHPDLILTSSDMYKIYEDAVQEFLMVINKDTNDPFYGSLQYRGADVAWLNTDRIPATHVYMLNSKYFEWVVDSDLNMWMTDWKQQTNVPLDRHAQVVLKGQLICSNRSKHGVLHS